MHSSLTPLMLLASVLCALLTIASSAVQGPSPISGINQNDEHDQVLMPCNHPLRLVLPPSLFSHCKTTCIYSEWSEWKTILSRVATNKTKCTSKYYDVQQQTREVDVFIGNSADCNDVNQTRKICHPTNAEKLIVYLGLGGSGQNYDTTTPAIVTNEGNLRKIPTTHSNSTTQKIRRQARASHRRIARKTNNTYGDGTRCPHTQTAGEVCQHLSSSRCGRSVSEHLSRKTQKRRDVEGHNSNIGRVRMDTVHDARAPIPFDWNIHGSHIRHRRQARCSNNDTQYVLFVLDSSGSIGRNNFVEMKNALAKLVPMFCKKIYTALINFSSNIKLEYCFNCFKNTYRGRAGAQDAIKNAEYLGGCTHTGATAKCICDNILTSSCGISNTECLDVVFITDGQSNDPNRRVCNEIKCLHNQVGINTYAIGIDGYDRNELECIAHNTDNFGMFEYETFQEFNDSINEVLELISIAAVELNNWHSCAVRDRSFSPTGSPYLG